MFAKYEFMRPQYVFPSGLNNTPGYYFIDFMFGYFYDIFFGKCTTKDSRFCKHVLHFQNKIERSKILYY